MPQLFMIYMKYFLGYVYVFICIFWLCLLVVAKITTDAKSSFYLLLIKSAMQNGSFDVKNLKVCHNFHKITNNLWVEKGRSRRRRRKSILCQEFISVCVNRKDCSLVYSAQIIKCLSAIKMCV